MKNGQKKVNTEENIKNQLFETFNFKVSSLNNISSENSYIYHPSADKGIDKTYTSYIKFIPNFKNPEKTLVRKWVVLLENPIYDERRAIDCPSSNNEFSLLQQAFFALYNSSDPYLKQKADYFRRREVFYSYIYIVNDEVLPEYNDKFLIFRFGRQIYDILTSAENDSLSPIQVYNIFAPYTFKINVIEKSGYNHYSRSKFIDKYFPIRIDNVEINKSNFNIIVDYIKNLDFSPEMYEYKPWDKDTTEFVVNTIYSIVDDPSTLKKIFKNIKELNGVVISTSNNIIFDNNEKESSINDININKFKIKETDNSLNDNDEEDFYKNTSNTNIDSRRNEKITSDKTDFNNKKKNIKETINNTTSSIRNNYEIEEDNEIIEEEDDDDTLTESRDFIKDDDVSDKTDSTASVSNDDLWNEFIKKYKK